MCTHSLEIDSSYRVETYGQPCTEELKLNGIPSVNDYVFNAHWASNNTNMSPEALYEKVVKNVSKIVQNLTIHLNSCIDKEHNVNFNFGDLTCGNQSLFVIKEYYYNGDCLILQLPEYITSAGPLEIMLELKENVDIFIHHKNQFLSPNSRTRASGVLGEYRKYSFSHEANILRP